MRASPRVQAVLRATGMYMDFELTTTEVWIRKQLDSVGEEERGSFVAIFWSIWKRKNTTVWKQHVQDIASVVNAGTGMLTSWKDVQVTEEGRIGSTGDRGNKWKNSG
ncbi:unnamed protein product, partial [Cuscuta europaea]